jgi:hypothetical protein
LVAKNRFVSYRIKFLILKRILNILFPVCLLISIVTINNNCKKESGEKNLPVLITVPASDITPVSALLGGQIAYDGGAEISVRGVCCGRKTNPDFSDLVKIAGQGTGCFTCSLTGLNQNTLYYARAFATNSEGTAYGGEVRFTTGSADAPTVITLMSVSASYYSASVGGRVKDNGGAPVTEKGICWGTTENPTILNDNKTISGYGNIDNYSPYECSIYPLQPKSVYNARAYAINIADTSYGDIVSVTTLSVPEVTTFAATEIAANSATVGGNVTSVGDASDAEIGICYGTQIDPSINGQHKIAGSTGTGEFKCSLTKLKAGILYHAKAYVGWGHDEFGPEWVVYGNEVTFTTVE